MEDGVSVREIPDEEIVDVIGLASAGRDADTGKALLIFRRTNGSDAYLTIPPAALGPLIVGVLSSAMQSVPELERGLSPQDREILSQGFLVEDVSADADHEGKIVAVQFRTAATMSLVFGLPVELAKKLQKAIGAAVSDLRSSRKPRRPH